VRRNVQTVNPVILIFVVMIGAMILMTRSARNKQRQAVEMRNQMEPGAGVRTIGGLYAVVKEVNDDTVLLELTDGVHAHFAKNAIGAVLGEDEFNRIVHGIEPEEPEGLHDTADGDDTDAPADSADAGDGAHEAAEQDGGDASASAKQQDGDRDGDRDAAVVDLGKSSDSAK
jgi:preprotein translocase subunit YajC